MKRGLRRRLLFTHLAVAVLAVCLVAIVVVVSAPGRFDTYQDDMQRDRDLTLVQTLADTYVQPNSWDATAIYALSRVAKANGVNAAVYSPEGQLLFTVQGRAEAVSATAKTGTSASPSAGTTTVSSEDYVVRRYTVSAAGKKVATVEIYAPRDAAGAAGASYESGLRRDLLLGALVAVALALVVSLAVSRRVTAPIEELSEVAVDAAAGDLDARVAPRGDDEVGALATAFNEMADRLARDQQWQRDMTADLSEELRAPLAAVKTRVDALAAGGSPDDARAVGAEIERLERLLGALRLLGELESEEPELAHEPSDLAAVAREAMARGEPAFAAKGIELIGDLSAVEVVAGRERVLRLVAELLDNALKFTPAGGRVTVSVARGNGPSDAAVLGGGLWARLAVVDSGPGIDPADLPFVFDRFYRGRAVRGAAGIGLGLALARGLAEAEGGAIEAAAAPESGALLTVYLPLA